MYPQGSALYLGAYDGGVAICHADLPCLFFPDSGGRRLFGAPQGPSGFTAHVLGLYPEGQVLAAVLHSTVDLWGFTLYGGGHVVRAAAGSADTGLTIDVGPALPEELSVTGGRSLSDRAENIEGEALVFAVTGRFFGCSLDEVDDWRLSLTDYRLQKRSFPSRLLGAS